MVSYELAYLLNPWVSKINVARIILKRNPESNGIKNKLQY
jgi:hypothetical protein